MANTSGLRRTAGPGRPKGAKNKTTAEVRAAATKLVNDKPYRAALKVRLLEGKAPHMETLLWHYAYGKPADSVEVSDPDGKPLGPVTFIVRARESASA